MEQYISKSALVAELEKFMYEANQEADIASTGECFDEKVADAKYQLCKQIRDFIDSLEVKEEVLDRNDKTKLMRKCVKIAYKRGYDMGVLQTTNKVNQNTKEVDLEKENLPISNSLIKEGLFTFEDGSQAIITKIS